MVSHSSRRLAMRALVIGAVSFSSAACMQVLGIEDAHVDPSLSEGGQAGTGNAGSGGTGGSGAVCKHFDNTRVTKLLPNGGLAPLPSHS